MPLLIGTTYSKRRPLSNLDDAHVSYDHTPRARRPNSYRAGLRRARENVSMRRSRSRATATGVAANKNDFAQLSHRFSRGPSRGAARSLPQAWRRARRRVDAMTRPPEATQASRGPRVLASLGPASDRLGPGGGCTTAGRKRVTSVHDAGACARGYVARHAARRGSVGVTGIAVAADLHRIWWRHHDRAMIASVSWGTDASAARHDQSTGATLTRSD
jgi:hypothetical protein